MKRFKINLAIVAMLIGVTAAFAFKPVPKKAITGRQTTVWYFDGVSGQVKDAVDWSTTDIPDDCALTGTLPCSISVSASNQTDLQTFLNGETVTQITNMSSERRP